MPRHKALLITGATGKQGRATIEALLSSPGSSNFTILALTRKITSPAARSLARKATNIKLVAGDLDNATAIFEAASKATPHPIWGVFGVTTPMGEGEERQGKNLIDAALASGVRRFVFSSVHRGLNSSSTPTNVPHFITKHNIEQHLKSAAAKSRGRMSWTILRPVAFMDNLTPDFQGRLFVTAWKWYLTIPETMFELISCADIGLIAAEVFLNPAEFRNRSLSLASDAISYDQADFVFQRKIGTDMPTACLYLALICFWSMKDFRLMFHWYRNERFGTDVVRFRNRFRGVLYFDDWLQQKSAFVKR